MQRMRLHTQGIKVPPLGSSQDKVLRQFAVREAELEAKRTEFQMLTLLTNPQIVEDQKWREWKDTVSGVWKKYVSMLFNEDISDENSSDKELIDYYTNVVKKSKLQMYKDKSTGQLKLIGAETLRKQN